MAAAIQSYDELRAAVAERRAELGMDHAALDAAAGLPIGFTSRFEGGSAYLNPANMPALLRALKLEMIVKLKEN